MIDTLLLFAVVAFVAIATPGPTVLLALTNGSRFGVRAALPGMLGAVLSDFVLVFAVAVGLGALLAASELLFSAVKWVGVAYLAYLGVRLLRSSGGMAAAPGDGQAAGAAAPRAIFMRSFLVAVTNPKGYLFCSALLPQFVNTAEPVAPQYLALGLVFAALDFLVMLAYARAGVQAIRVLRDRGLLWLERLSGAALLTLAGALALVRRQP
jgi:threonine/homoserine/homoserine lactone efflux protein